MDQTEAQAFAVRAEDIFAKIAKTNYRMWKSRNEDVLRLAGCPVSVAEQVLMLVKLGKLRNPYFDIDQASSFLSAYFSKKTHDAIQRVLGKPYQTPRGAAEVTRGAARPKQNLPAKA